MADTLFYADAIPVVGQRAVVDGDEGFHAATVRRIRPGEKLVLSDGDGTLARCEVEETSKRGFSAQVLERWTRPRAHPTVTVAQGIPKSERSELAIELATEAGADDFVAWQADRCVARWDGERAEKGLRRWRAVARSAARQSRRGYIPPIDGPVATAALADLVAGRVGSGGLVLALHESADRPLAELPVAQADSIMLIVGPEGGISDAELDRLAEAGATAVRLGPTVLRTTTAAAVALGALGVLTGRWSDQRR
ncbi:16S rRNA (uracil(1498)-N(3))-methyltransferase [Mycolicibacterium aichiense]|uniref:Ribosomal RNA small subunit methyltransferase E n=1 Tax=Mycolicibacterium aichiense TaxID=1799 RepID=A0AAD1MDD9_9MYCO|nr:16S rRNA (uracil(1498)-N(3))-methyltransferase [Mycolicibacterium aichiense]MCV7018247.1 16S rRNA (uracil(1498)-N(3))-methyltransferase [Mycolicibacterium aichiense]BBX08731.1 ribosomal RNA small subunit methyltransferase E [Mycolicibacterium aichiense]STZ82524.1 16S ribosomal RNA methyltransferase RsmE [Mycolicibacterium aichiense]